LSRITKQVTRSRKDDNFIWFRFDTVLHIFTACACLMFIQPQKYISKKRMSVIVNNIIQSNSRNTDKEKRKKGIKQQWKDRRLTDIGCGFCFVSFFTADGILYIKKKNLANLCPCCVWLVKFWHVLVYIATG
jgi:hypothetical protein